MAKKENEYIRYNITAPIHITPPPMNMIFSDVEHDGKEIGAFTWDKTGFKFKGNASKSAKIFIDYCKQIADDYIKDNYVEKPKE